MVNLTIRINDFLSGLFFGVGIKLVDFKVEFGRLWENEFMRIVLADEISPDSCRLWDSQTNEKMDKDRFRRDLGGVAEAYSEVATRLGIMPGIDPGREQGTGAGEVKARVYVTLKNGVLDPQGKAIGHALHGLGFAGVGEVRQGKIIEIELAEKDEAKARAALKDMCEKLLANTVIEKYDRDRSLEAGPPSRKHGVMKSAVIVFPASNCDRDVPWRWSRSRRSRRYGLARRYRTSRGRPDRAARRLFLWRLSALRRDGGAVAHHARRQGQGAEGRGGAWHLQRLSGVDRSGAACPAR